jgi:hypothetical protein
MSCYILCYGPKDAIAIQTHVFRPIIAQIHLLHNGLPAMSKAIERAMGGNFDDACLFGNAFGASGAGRL